MVSIKEELLNVFKTIYETYSASVIKIKDYILAWETGYYGEIDDSAGGRGGRLGGCEARERRVLKDD